MDEYEKIYFDEFQHAVKDLGEKITITSLSDKYERSIMEISTALAKWVEKEGNQNFKKEYILRGIHKNGYSLITIVPEDKLEKAKDAIKDSYAFLYSVDKSTSSPSLDLIQLSAVKKKNLILPDTVLQEKPTKRKDHSKQGEGTSKLPQQVETIQERKVVASAPNNFFKNPNTTNKKDKVKENDKESRNQNDTKPSELSPLKKLKTKDNSPEIKKDLKPQNGKNKKTIPLAGKSSKGSIASFFSAKPVIAGKTEKTVIEDNAREKKEDKIIANKSDNNENGADLIEKNQHKKSLDNDEKRPDTKPLANDKDKTIKKDTVENKSKGNIVKKRPLEDSESKKQEKPAKKPRTIAAGRRRIIMDSSDEENEAIEENIVVEVKQPEPEVVLIEEDTKEDDTKENTKEHTKEDEEPVEIKPSLDPETYEDEDGFLITIKDKKQAPKKVEKKTPVKKNLKKLDKVPVKAATKQGSIRNFFMKK